MQNTSHIVRGKRKLETSKTGWLLTRHSKAFRKPWAMILAFIGPALIYYGIFIIYPLSATIYNSFHTIAPRAGTLVTTFVGLENYKKLFSDRIFIQSVQHTLIWGGVGPIIEMATATLLAFIVYFKVPLHKFYRVAWFTPVLITGVIVGMVFRWIFNYDWGLINVALRTFGLKDFAINWLGNLSTPLWVVIFVHYWNTFGYSFILLLAGLSSIDPSLLESASIDGATRSQMCLHILLPLLLPMFATVLILSFMGKMRAFHVVWVLTGGGPMHASETIATYVQKRAFGWKTMDLGYPSAIAIFWFITVIVAVGLINKWFQSRIKKYY